MATTTDRHYSDSDLLCGGRRRRTMAHVEICQAHPGIFPRRAGSGNYVKWGCFDLGKIRQEHTWKYMSSTPRAVFYPEESRSRNYVQRVVPSLLTFGKQPLLPRRPLNKIPTPSSPAWGMMPSLSAASLESFAFFPPLAAAYRATRIRQTGFRVC